METKKYGVISSIIMVILGYGLSAIFATVVFLFGAIALIEDFGITAILVCYTLLFCVFLSLYYWWLSKRKKFGDTIIKTNLIYTGIVFAVFTAVFMIADASLLHPLMMVPLYVAFPFFPIYVMGALFSGTYSVMMMVGVTLLYTAIFLLLITKKWKWSSTVAVFAVCAVCCLYTYFDSPHYKYKNQGHNFSYMNGYSSIDLSDYTPYSDSGKLVALDHKADLWIENKEDMPVLDGAEACYSVYSAIAKAIYKDIDKIEKKYADTYEKTGENGEIVSFYNTAIGFERLVDREVDMFFGAKPSESQLKYAEKHNVELVYTPVGYEAFVFFVNEDNPVEGLTSEEIRGIYHGNITNWREVGGKNKEIIAFQRPERSGSQSMMVHFMGDVELKEPMTYEMEYAMSGIIEEVAEYHNEAGAIGYSFRYFLEGLHQEEGVKMLSVDGVYPSTESISSREYPVVTPLYCITVKGNENENVQKVIDFLLSEDGQYIIEETGYSPVK